MQSREQLREAYHEIIKKEFEKYKQGNPANVYLTTQDFLSLRIDQNLVNQLKSRGFLVELGNDKFRSLLMDVAIRATDIRVQYKGTKYVLESKLELRPRPILDWNYVRFDSSSPALSEFENLLSSKIPNIYVEGLIKGLKNAGIEGLSYYQFESIKVFLQSKRDVVISAPTAFGKTYIFLIPILLSALKAEHERKRGVIATIFYPRKSLGSDQMSRLIRLVYHVNKACGTKITVGIQDGDTGKLEGEGENFRGIECPLDPGEQLIIKDNKVFCRKCNTTFDFIRAKREDFERDPPKILITNIWAYPYRLLDNKYWNNGYLSSQIEFFVFDEVHAYKDIIAGMLRYFIKTLKSLVSKDAKIVLSSATLPEGFASDILGKEEKEIDILEYDEKKHGSSFQKLELYLMVGINPYESWETYVNELAIYLSTANRLIQKNNLKSLIFIDSIRNISRLRDQVSEAIKLGDPKDHLLLTIPPEDTFNYWVYNPNYALQSLQDPRLQQLLQPLQDEIEKRIETHYADKLDRFEIEKRLKSKDQSDTLDVVFTTSTLELGVDYDTVSVVVNAGIPPNIDSIVQRVGRAGRSDSTLYTALSIIIVRNDPLEYFYIYQGLDQLIGTLQKIPVSYENIFVKFYSVLLYLLVCRIRSGGQIDTEPSKLLNELKEDLNSSKKIIEQELGIRISELNKLEEELEDAVKGLNDPDIAQKIEQKHISDSCTSLKKSIEDVVSNLENILLEIDKKQNQIDKNTLNMINNLKSELSKLKVNLIDYDELCNIIDLINDLLSLIARNRDFHPLSDLMGDLRKIRDHLEDERDILGNIRQGIQNIEKVKYSNVYRIEELIHLSKQVSKQASWSPSAWAIELIGRFFGFRFMGNEFIDQMVRVGICSENLLFQVQSDDENLSNVLFRTPPFELVEPAFEKKDLKELTKKVKAHHFWLIKPKKPNNYINRGSNSKLKDNLDKYKIGRGEAADFKDMFVPNCIYFVDLLTLNDPVIFTMQAEDGKNLVIKYGSKTFGEYQVNGKYSMSENIKKLYGNKDTSKYYIAIKDATINAINQLDERIKVSNRWGLTFRYVAYCYFGRCISTDPFDDKCPLQTCCGQSDHQKFWSGARLRGISPRRKMFPKFYLNLTVRNLPEIKRNLIFNVDTLMFNDLEREIEFLYNSVSAYLPTYSGYIIRKIPLEPIGYRARTSLVYLWFNDALLEKFIDSLLGRNILNILKFKFFMYNELKKYGSLFDAVLNYKKYSPSSIDAGNTRFREFIKEALIHTLAHLFFIYLAEKVGVANIDKLVYFFDTKSDTIYVLENSKNDGMGFVETIKNKIDNDKNGFIKDFFEWAKNYLDKHDKFIQKEESDLVREANDLMSNTNSQQFDAMLLREINNLREIVSGLNEDIQSYISLDYVDLITYRLILSNKLGLEKRDIDVNRISQYLLPVIHSNGVPHLCVDGCNECLIFDRGCRDPFAQNYVLSKQLAYEFLRFVSGGYLHIIGRNLGKIVESLMDEADEIVVKSPFIDEYGFNILCKYHQKRKRIRVITRSDNQFVRKLSDLGIAVKTSNNFHSKLYVFIKGGEKVVVEGSLNLTRSSFEENEENLTVIWGPEKIKDINEVDI